MRDTAMSSVKAQGVDGVVFHFLLVIGVSFNNKIFFELATF